MKSTGSLFAALAAAALLVASCTEGNDPAGGSGDPAVAASEQGSDANDPEAAPQGATSERILVSEGVTLAFNNPGDLYFFDPVTLDTTVASSGVVVGDGQQSLRGDLALVENSEAGQDVFFTASETSRRLLDVTEAPGSITPDSTAVAFVSADGLETVSPAGVGRALVSDVVSHGDLSWAPDSVRIAINGPAANEISVVDTGSGEIDTVYEGDYPIVTHRWEPNGSRVAFLETADTGSGISQVVKIVDTATGEQTTLDNISNFVPDEPFSWSPDGEQVLVTVRRPDDNGDPVVGLKLIDPSNGASELVEADGFPVITQPRWSPDSTRVVVGARDPGDLDESDGIDLVVVIVDINSGETTPTPFFGYPQSWAAYGTPTPTFTDDPPGGESGEGASLPEPQTRESNDLGCAPCTDVVRIDANTDGVEDAVALRYAPEDVAPVISFFDGADGAERVRVDLAGSKPAQINAALPRLAAVIPGEESFVAVVYADRISGSRFFEAWRITLDGSAEMLDGRPFDDFSDGAVGAFWGCQTAGGAVQIVSSELYHNPDEPDVGVQLITVYGYDGVSVVPIDTQELRHQLSSNYGSVFESAVYTESPCLERSP